MTFAPNDRVHVAALGKGIVREVRNGGRYLVDIKGRSIVTTIEQLTSDEGPRKPVRAKASISTTGRRTFHESVRSVPDSLDLHGQTVDEALDAVSLFLNALLLAGSAGAQIIHGRSGGRLKAAVHAQLKRMPSVRSFALDPRNPGVTIVKL